MKTNFLVFLVISFLVFPRCIHKGPVLLAPDNPHLEYEGRIDSGSLDSVAFFWPGTSVEFAFMGKNLFVTLDDISGKNFYNVILDDTLFLLNCKKGKHKYELASGLARGKHQVKLFKRTEFPVGTTWFYGFEITGRSKILKMPKKERTIEFFGNSITCGYGVEDYSGNDSPDSTYTNNYLTYAALTARHFDANYFCTSRSGIGIMISWYPQIMPELWYRLNPNDSASRWDFNAVQPDIAVINLFQNDSWLVNMPERKEFIYTFGDTPPKEDYVIDSYTRFVLSVREVYPNTHLICALGSMDATKEGSPWPGYVEKAVSSIRKETGDRKIFTLFFPYKETPGHPRIEEQEDMANRLISFIEENIEW